MPNPFAQFVAPAAPQNPFAQFVAGPDPYSPEELAKQKQAAYESNLARVNMRAAQNEQANPERNPFAEVGDRFVDTALQAGLPMAAGVGSLMTGIGAAGAVPVTAAVGAFGNRAAHLYRQARGYETEMGNPVNNMAEDLGMGATAALGMMTPAVPALKTSTRLLNPLLSAAYEPAAHAVAGGAVNAAMDVMNQVVQKGDAASEIDVKRAIQMFGVGAVTSAMFGIQQGMDQYKANSQTRKNFVDAANKMGLGHIKTYEDLRDHLFKLERDVFQPRQNREGSIDIETTPVSSKQAPNPLLALPEPVITAPTSIPPIELAAGRPQPIVPRPQTPELSNPLVPNTTETPAELAAIGRARVDLASQRLAEAFAGATPEDVAIRQLALSLMGRTPAQSAKAIRERIKLTEDPEDKAKLVEEADRLENVAAKQDEAQARQDAIQQAHDDAQAKLEELHGRTQEVHDAQQAMVEQQQKAIEEQNKAATDAKKQQEQQLAEAQKLEGETKLEAQKPIVLANSAAQTAKNMEDQPGTAQGQLNAITKPAQPAPEPVLNNPITGAPMNQPVTDKPIPDLEDRVVSWLTGVGEKPSAPSKLYRGVIEGHPEPTSGHIHYSPWRFIAERGGKGSFGGKHNVIESTPLDGHKYYRGGSLAGDPLESTRILSHKGISWDDAITQTEALYQEILADKLKGNKAWLKKLSGEEKEKRINAIKKHSAKEALTHLVSGTMETDVSNKAGIWVGKKTPKGLNQETPILRESKKPVAPAAVKPEITVGMSNEDILKAHDPEKLAYLDEQLSTGELSPDDHRQRLQESADSFRNKGGEEPMVQKAAVQKKSANVGRIVKMMGDKLYSADTSKTTGKELFQNSADAVMRNPEGSARVIWTGKDEDGRFVIADNGPGMSPELIVDKFLPAGESGKAVGSAGGLGLAKIAILGGNEGWRVTSVTRAPDGRLIRSELNGTGLAYYDYIDNPPSVDLKPNTEIRLSDGMTLHYEYLPEDEFAQTGTVAQIKTKAPYESMYFVSDAVKYTPSIAHMGINTWDTPDKSTILGQADLSSSGQEQGSRGEAMNLMHTIPTDFGSIEFIVPSDSRMAKKSYLYYDVLNRGILQYKGQMNFNDDVALPKGLAVNIKPTVEAAHPDYPFTTNREDVTPKAKALVEDYLKSFGQQEVKRTNDIYRNAVQSAPKMAHNNGLVFLDAGQSVSPELMNEIVNSKTVSAVTNDVADIQNAILKILAKRYPLDGYNKRKFGRAIFRGLLTGGNAYGVHFGAEQADETGIYHDIFLTWRDALVEAAGAVEDIGQGEAQMAKEANELTYKFFRAKISGIALHEALHQVINSEGEDLARGLTFKAGDMLEAVQSLTEKEKTPEEYQAINQDLTRYGTELSNQRAPEEAGNLIVSQGGYNGYALKHTGADAQGAVAAGGQNQPPQGPSGPQAQGAGAGEPEPTRYGSAEGNPPPDDRDARRKGSFRRQQRGAVASDVLPGAAGAVAGAASGYLGAEKRDDETEEQFQARRLGYMVLGGFMGGTAAHTLGQWATKSGAVRRAEVLQAIQREARGVDAPAWWVKLRAKEQLADAPILNKISPAGIRNVTNNTYARFSDLVAHAVLAGQHVPEYANFHGQSLTMGPKLLEAFRKQDEIEKAIQSRIVDAGKASGMGVDNFISRFNNWLVARDAPYHNKFLEGYHIHTGGQGPAPTGRYTDAEATAIMDQARTDGLEQVFTSLAKPYKSQVEAIRNILERGELITPETRKTWDKLFPYYIPRNRILPEDNTDDAVLQHLGGGPGNSVISSGAKRLNKEGSQLDVQDIGGSLRANMHDALTRVYHNEMVKSAANFIYHQEANGTPIDGVEIRSPKIQMSGIGSNIKPEQFDPNRMVSFMENGKPKWIVFDNPMMANAVSGLSPDKLNFFFRTLGRVNKTWSRLATGYNIDFLFRNPIMDRSGAAWKALTLGDTAGATQMVNPIGGMKDMLDVAQWHAGKQTPGAAMVQQGLDAGMMGGGYASASRDAAYKSIDDMRHIKTNPAKASLHAVKSIFNYLSELSEMTTRKRAYARALEMGATPQEAAVQALNSSINFAMKGKQKMASASYQFYNPAQQSGWNQFKNIIRNPRVTASILASAAGFLYALNAHNSSIDPDWQRRPKIAWAQANGPVFVYGVDPETKETQFVTLPVAQDMRPTLSGVNLMMDWLRGDIKKGDNMADRMSQFAGAVVNAGNPVGAGPVGDKGVAGSIVSMAMPTIGRPLTDIMSNKSYTGQPIVPDRMNIDSMLNESDKVRASTYNNRLGQWAISISKWLKENMNYDVSPENIKYLVSAYSSGPGRLATGIVNTLAPADGQKVAASDLPVVGSFVRRAEQQDEDTKTSDLNYAKDIATKFHSVDTERHTKAVAFFDKNFKKVDPTKWVDTFWKMDKQKGIPAGQDERQAIVDVLTDKIKGLDNVDAIVKNMKVANGERASYYFSMKRNFKTDAEYKKYLQDQWNKKLLSQEVYQQWMNLQSNPFASLVK